MFITVTAGPVNLKTSWGDVASTSMSRMQFIRAQLAVTISKSQPSLAWQGGNRRVRSVLGKGDQNTHHKIVGFQ